ncbi:hypothetical protein AOQ84DRAFT_53400 [Glonium stellatum]|uniref:Uncharacterized protein n=1 Tax=Glonium stellatum TaxID=574774 RepID=A0A8E2EZG6_9PEZI|nr:hypothetical protein AOQ84DRAFT_53400 [Glonium stellatum]
MAGKAGGMADKIVASMWPSSARRAGRYGRAAQSYDGLARRLHKINASQNQLPGIYVTTRGNLSIPPPLPRRITSPPPPRQTAAGHASAQEKLPQHQRTPKKQDPRRDILKIAVLLL